MVSLGDDPSCGMFIVPVDEPSATGDLYSREFPIKNNRDMPKNRASAQQNRDQDPVFERF